MWRVWLGDKFHRPHYHAIVYGVDKSRHAEIISRCWINGYNYIGLVTYDSCRYVAGYIDKKYGTTTNLERYEKFGLAVPFQLQSKGIGKRYALSHIDYLSSGRLTVRGTPISLPRYFVKVTGIQPEYDGTTQVFHKWIEDYSGKGKILDQVEQAGHVKELYEKTKKEILGKR